MYMYKYNYDTLDNFNSMQSNKEIQPTSAGCSPASMINAT